MPIHARELVLETPSFVGLDRMRYETPDGGTSLTRYIVRRLHKTALLRGIEDQLRGDPTSALAQFAFYAVASGTSWGPALYQPTFQRPGVEVSEPDPDTGAIVTARFVTQDPHYTFAFDIQLPDSGSVRGQESVTGTTIGLHGLGMPAPSRYTYMSADGSYQASAIGTIHSELAPRLFAHWQIRGHGRLELEDNLGARGSAELSRNGLISLRIQPANGPTRKLQWQIT